ncbi:hypothetical protein PV328_003091 [Microctonus aethiopoides]|uniref:F-box domain-containing protein n=1 Tax=Microctonus aethiopoides TaxID=144406 RepID=A0AA39F7M8_9HYME|nr:hypothetical protein PV328_003091 [Microctonus aethiopoides]
MSLKKENEDNNVDDVSSDESYDEMDTELQLSLNTLPVEIFLHICSFLDSSTLVHRLGLVCKQFYNILRDDSLWKGRINKLWPNTRYPILPPADDDKLFWKSSCVTAERQYFLWKNLHATENLYLKDAHEACVDGLLLIDKGRVCISGGRDRMLVCWRLNETEDEDKIEMHEGQGHDGWIWDITSMQNKIYSCSWDKRVHVWDYDNGQIKLLEKLPLRITGALLCISSSPEQNLIATGSSCKLISIIDPRNHDPFVNQFRPHRGAVLNIAMNTKYIISTSEDKTVSIWDQRSQRTLKSLMLSKESYPRCVSMQTDAIYIGDSEGYIHILDVNNDFEPMKSYKTQHTDGITGIHMTGGSLITSSLDSTVIISTPTDPLHTISRLHCRYGKIVKMSYLNDVLAICGGNSIEVWRPRIGDVC